MQYQAARKPEEPDFDLSNKTPEELANLGIFTPIEQRFDEQKQPYWIISNQKIVSVDAELPGLEGFLRQQREPADGRKDQGDNWKGKAAYATQEVIPRPPALENSVKNFFRSLLDFLLAWLRWLFGDKKPDEPQRPKIDDGKLVWFFENNPKQKIDFKVARVSECPNGDSEFGGRRSYTVLLEWTERIPVSDLADFTELYGQADNNLIINPQPPNNDVGWPPKASAGRLVKVHPSDFMAFNAEDAAFYTDREKKCAKDPIVAVMDTGLVYKWKDPKTGAIQRHYARNGEKIYFSLAKAHSADCTPNADFGYCGVTDYSRRPVPFQQLSILDGVSLAVVPPSPYDDNLVDEEITENGVSKTTTDGGRHGSLITAILNQQQCRVLPIKAFNGAGMGTLFDLLCCCNYLMARKRAGVEIKVLNASFSGRLDAVGIAFLRSKMKAITDLGTWVVAAAGNIDADLTATQLYPALFGSVLDKVIIVNSKYGGRTGSIRGGTGAAVALTAISSRAGGFPSAIPVQGGDLVQGTSFAAPYVAAALSRLPLGTMSRNDVLIQVRTMDLGGVTFE